MSRHAAVCAVRHWIRRHRAVAVVGVALGLAGCGGGVALNRSFNDYAAVYADLSNRQLLMNLARMANIHPPHFLQLGNINASFQFGANASANVGGSRASGRTPGPGGTGQTPFTLLSRATQWGASLGATFGEQPTFSFTPLSGPQFAKGILSPVPGSVFFTLLDQGEGIDQLMRIMVQAIEYTDPVAQRRITLVNLPSPDNVESYVQFLRLVGIAAELQRQQLIRAATTTTTVPVPSPPFDIPNLEQMIKLAEKGLTVQPAPGQPGKFVIATTTTSSALLVAPEAADLWQELTKQPYFRIVPPGPGRPSAAPAPGSPPPPFEGFTMKLRSFFEILSWVATEQDKFEALAAKPGFLDSIPPSQRHPVLRLTWDKVKEEIESPVVALEYGKHVYAITDVRGQTWNRDVFTLLSYIGSQVAIDPKDLPIQQLINVR